MPEAVYRTVTPLSTAAVAAEVTRCTYRYYVEWPQAR